MEPVWFVLVAVMIIAYVVLDGFDLGAGVLHLLIARAEEERKRQRLPPSLLIEDVSDRVLLFRTPASAPRHLRSSLATNHQLT
jgi:hypothetical protein